MVSPIASQEAAAEPPRGVRFTARLYRVWLLAGAVVGFLSVGIAAGAAHVLPQKVGAAGLGLVNIALGLQSWHAAVLLACGLWARGTGGRLVHTAAALILLGLVLFCAAIYALVLGVPLGGFAPFGGTTLLIGWVVLAAAALGA